ncbi:MAG: hypothetical protein AAGG50_00270 [Bacteroidota bacterium]
MSTTSTRLTLDLFASDDAELVQYRLLAGLQRARQAFDQTRVYPHLADLIRLRRALLDLRGQAEALRNAQPGRIQRIDWEKQEVVYERPDLPPVLPMDDLVDWTLPRLTTAIEEGQAIYEFVEQHTAIEAVGVVPTYQDEGYLLVPTTDGYRAVRYTVSVLVGTDADAGCERYRSLRTSEVPLPAAATEPGACKHALAQHHRDLPNPATYCIRADLDVPTEATLMPVAKRKLLHYLASGGPFGQA